MELTLDTLNIIIIGGLNMELNTFIVKVGKKLREIRKVQEKNKKTEKEIESLKKKLKNYKKNFLEVGKKKKKNS